MLTEWDMHIALLILLMWISPYRQDAVRGEDEARCERFLKNETLSPNLKLRATTRISGNLSDNNRVSLKDWPVELRVWESRKRQLRLKKVQTDGEGHFDFGLVGPGEYRLLAGPDRSWEQIRKVECVGTGDCNLNVLIYPAEGEIAGKSCPVQ
jgi:hypothetical protein